ncbi:MAG: glycoside hydrolase family 6 protein, partial [Microbacteriaceae bacterium]|nr:glycoside hydrolase family 6 protein [Microbacteriaceae bacterium]
MSHRTRTAALIGAGLAAATFVVTASTPALAGTPHGPVAPQKASHALGDVPLFVRSADPAALTQEAQLTASGDTKDAAALANVLATPQAVWLTGGTPDQVRKTVQQTIAAATVQKTVPVFVAYDIPGRDCSEYSAGGAADTAAYEAWIDGVAAGIGNTKAVVLVEPDSVGLLPQTTCIDQDGLSPSVYPFTDAERFTELNAAVSALEAKPNTSVYLDGTNSAWLDVPSLSDRLIAAGVNRAQGFFLNVSNYQLTGNNVDFGTWVSDCIALRGQDASANCPSQYWNGGPDGTAIAGLLGAWNGVALSPYGAWSDTATDPALNTSGITAQYASALAAAGVQPTAHLVIDTSRNGTGPNPMTAYAAAPYDQSAATVGALAAA